MRIFQYDPFRYRSADQSTVGALRSEAADVDLSYRSSEQLRHFRDAGGVATIEQLVHVGARSAKQ